MDKEISDIRSEALRLAWWMRGGLPYDQAMQLGVAERKIIAKIIEDNIFFCLTSYFCLNGFSIKLNEI